MNEQTLFYLIVGIVLFGYLLERFLEFLNKKNWSNNLPKEFEGYYDEEKYKKSQDYFLVKNRFGFITATFSLAVMLVMLFFDGFAWVDSFVRGYTESPVWMTLIFFGVLMFASDIINIPFSIYSIFVIEEKFGFNKTTVKTFIFDKIKTWLLGFLIGGGLLALIVLIYNETGNMFWIYTWIVITVFTVFITMFYSSLIVPLFNKQTPLGEGELKTSIQNYIKKAGFKLKNVFVIDGSKRSTKANAYFTGLGTNKRIVLFDTLINDHKTEELVAVLAHEVGHYKKKHIITGLIIGIIQTGVMLFVFSLIVDNKILSEALGAKQQSFHLGLIAFTILYSPLSLVLGLAMNVLSRKNEYEADRFARETASAEDLIVALKKLSVNNLSNLTPHPAYVFFHYSHPPLLERVKALRG